MWPYTEQERDWLDRAATVAHRPDAVHITPACLAYYLRRGRRLRAEAVGRMAARLGSAFVHLFTLGARKRRRQTRLDDDFLALVASGLRTPLTSIRSSAEILRDYPDLTPEQRRHFLEVVIAEDERLAQVISEILDASEYEADKRRWQVRAKPLEERLSHPSA
jgi:signal transduction histidine kinase